MSRSRSRDGVTAGFLAVAVHGFFVLLLVLGVSWQIHDPQPVLADIWQSLPQPARPEPAPSPRPAPLPEPAPQPETRPQPVPEDKAADIALEKKKREEAELQKKREQELAEQKRRKEAELQQKREQELAEQKQRKEAELQKKREQEKKLAEQKQREALQREEADLQRRMLEESLAAEAGQLKARAAEARRASEIDKMVAQYQGLISAKIRGNTRLPENLAGNPQAVFRLSVLPTGEIVKISLAKSSGNAAYDEAVRRGIEKSSPLPLPPDKAAAEKFRDLELKHKARE